MTMFGSQWLANAGADYEISQSIRFNDDDAAYLYRDNDAAQTDTKKFTYSVWIKRGAITGGTNTGLLSGGAGTTSGRSDFIFTAGSATGDSSNNDSLKFDIYTGGWTQIRATAKLRDPGAWSHIVLVYDAANSTANDTLIMYHNGSRLTLDSTSGVPNNLSLINANGQRTRVGADASGTPVEYDGYMAEINMIDGQALTPASFGETNDDGVWVPKAYSGSYGNNGFFIDGRDSSDLGDDESGNGNDFTSTGLAAADQMSDTPTNNSSIFSPIASCNVSGQTLTISDGNLRTSAGGTSNAIEAVTQIGPSAGKYYAEFTLNAAPQLSNQYPVIGVIGADLNITGGNNVGNSTYRGYIPNGTISGGASYGDTFGNGDVIGVALDLDNQKIWFSKNGTYQNSGDPAAGSNAAFTNLTDGLFYRFCISHAGSTATDVTGNFGASAFATAAPTGFKALNTANLPTPTIKDGSKYFQTALYTGTTGAQDITFSGNSDLAPDWLWFKARSAGSDHFLFDKVRGALKTISSNDNTAEESSTGSMTAFGTDGFSLGDGGTANDINGVSGTTYAAWGWSAGNSTGSSNTDGDITSTVTANTTSGFSVLTYTGNGSDNQEIGHGIGIAPKMIFSKRTNTTGNWTMYHDAVGINKVMYLNLTNLPASNTEQYRATPSSSVYTVGVGGDINASGGSYVAYCFAEVEGFSKMGSYVANASTDGPFIYCGFHPGFVIFFSIAGSGAGRWMLDPTRSPFNPADDIFQANTTASEDTNSSYNLDFLSNGFKVRTASDFNSSGRTIAFAAFAENPFGGDGIAPGTAR